MVGVGSVLAPLKVSNLRSSVSEADKAEPAGVIHTYHNYFTNIVADYTVRQKHIFDQFCDYTSISGFRFLHSRHPIWFRAVSSVILFGSLGILFYHSSIFVSRFTDKQRHLHLSTTKAEEAPVPSLIVCPVQQFRQCLIEYGVEVFSESLPVWLKSISNYEGPADLLHFIASYPTSPSEMPRLTVNDKGQTLHDLLGEARGRLANLRAILLNRSSIDATLVQELASFSSEYRGVFPHAASLMNISAAMDFVTRDRRQTYTTFAGLRSWKLQNDDCFQRFIAGKKDIPALALCRHEKVGYQLREFHGKLEEFSIYAAEKAQRPAKDTFLHCRWLDGGPCEYELVMSDVGVRCFRVTGRNHLNATYITLKNAVQLLIDLWAFDNQVGNWKKHELKVRLEPLDSPIAKDNATGRICSSHDSFSMQAGRHLDLNIAFMRARSDQAGACDFLPTSKTLLPTRANISELEDPEKKNSPTNSTTDIKYSRDCRHAKCYQTADYRVDLGHSAVRLFDNHRLTARALDRRRKEQHALYEKSERLGSGVMLPDLYQEAESIVADFFDGHTALFSMFSSASGTSGDQAMEELISQSGVYSMMPVGPFILPKCAYATETMDYIREFWRREQASEVNPPQFSIGLIGVIAANVSPLRILFYYNYASRLDALNEYLEGLIERLLHILSTAMSSGNSQSGVAAGGIPPVGCENFAADVKKYLNVRMENTPLVQRSRFDERSSVLVERLRLLLASRSAMNQYGDYANNNLASVQLRYRSMTKVSIEESYKYSSFNLLVDLGSTLGLYFGLTTLTIFEIVVFAFYRDASDPFAIKTLPPPEAIYNIPAKNGRRQTPIARGKEELQANGSTPAKGKDKTKWRKPHSQHHQRHSHCIIPTIY